MLLTIDIGNSHSVIGIFDDGLLKRRWRVSTDRRRSVDETYLLLDGLLRIASFSVQDVDGLIISSVVPPVTPIFVDVGRVYLNLDPMVVGVGLKTGMPIVVENPREVGADRIVNGVAAYRQCETALIVVDLGTAITFDVVDAQGRYRGGAIAPGLGLSLDALFSQTAKLPRVDLVPPKKTIGRNTSESIQSGVFYGAVAMVDGMVERMKAELGEDPLSVIATGGYAEHVADSSRTIQRVDQDLTLHGLHYLYGLNTQP